MAKNIFQQLADFSDNRPPLDTTQFEDPIALKTKWTLVKGGGATFRTHTFVVKDSFRVEFRPSVRGYFFDTLFLLGGTGVLIAVILKWSQYSSVELFTGILVGATFVAAGGVMLYSDTTPIVFDTQQGGFWKGRKAPGNESDVRSLKNYAPMNDIHALQLIGQLVRDRRRVYYNYELNLVLNDARRIHVVGHSDQDGLREDAKRLSEFLGKPVWDAT